jgi:type II secretory pathway pseudopilin PulG
MRLQPEQLTRWARAGRRGVTLIEAMIALGALAIGTAGVASMMTNVSNATKKASFQTQALDVFAAFSTQVQDATCDVLPDGTTDADPGLAVNAGGYTAAVAGSAVTLVGAWPGLPPAQKLTVLYSVTPTPGLPVGAPPAFDLTVQICEFNSHDEILAAAAPCAWGLRAGWVRVFPLHKVCTFRLDQTGRGE